MRDIYQLLVKGPREFKGLSDEELAESADVYAAGAFAIRSALTLIGNLAYDAASAEEYSGDDARRDLILVSHALRHLPELERALRNSSQSADGVRAATRIAGGQKR